MPSFIPIRCTLLLAISLFVHVDTLGKPPFFPSITFLYSYHNNQSSLPSVLAFPASFSNNRNPIWQNVRYLASFKHAQMGPIWTPSQFHVTLVGCGCPLPYHLGLNQLPTNPSKPFSKDEETE